MRLSPSTSRDGGRDARRWTALRGPSADVARIPPCFSRIISPNYRRLQATLAAITGCPLMSVARTGLEGLRLRHRRLSSWYGLRLASGLKTKGEQHENYKAQESNAN